MLSDADRKKAADTLMDAEKTRKQAVQLSTTWPNITPTRSRPRWPIARSPPAPS
jgi:hypothetical protein